MKNEMVTVESLSGLQLNELKEMANTFGEKCQQAAKKTVQDAITAGTALLAAKAKCDHGTWVKWLGENWDYSRKTAFVYMSLASNVTRVTFENAGSIREAIGMIASESADPESSENSGQMTPRTERKSGRVEVVESLAGSVTEDEPELYIDDDPSPSPPTQRKTAAGSRRKPESEKPPTRPVVPEIVEDQAEAGLDTVEAFLEAVSPVQVVRHILSRISDESLRVKEARKIRKELDKFDPPKMPIPTIQEVADYAAERGWSTFDAEKFWNHYELADWKYGKAKTPLTKWHTAAGQAWGDGHGWASTSSNGKEHSNGYQTPNQRRESVTASSFAAIRAAAAEARAAASGGEG